MNDSTAVERYQGNEQRAVSSSVVEATTTPGRMTIEQVIMGWLDAKSKRTQSEKTARAYHDTITQFRAILRTGGLDLDGDPALVATLGQGYAGQSTKGAAVSPATFNQRLAILSSFYTYAQKRDVLERNPITLVDRRPVQHKEAARSLDQMGIDVQARLHAIDRAELRGARDYALLSVLLVTGRRAGELASLRYGDIRFKGKKATAITWQRCKGAKVMYDELPTSTTHALLAYLHQAYGATLASLDKNAPVWVSVSRHNEGKAISAQAIADICELRLGTSKVHATRHTFAVAMEQAGAKLSDIGARLGHNDLKTTSEYMKRLHSAENAYAGKIEVLFGIE